jgi:cytochrome P450
MNARAPVTDWLTDFDFLAPQWIADPFTIWDEIRSKCPMAHSNRFNGVYLPTRYQDVRDIAYDTRHFSSKRVVVREKHMPGRASSSPPINLDPPDHRPARMVLLPAFGPQAIAGLEARIRALCNELLDQVVGKDRADGSVDYAQHIPARIMAHMLGVPESSGDLFREWIHLVLVAGVDDVKSLRRGITEMTAYFIEQVAARKSHPGNDLISYLLAAEWKGHKFDDRHVVDTLRLLLIAGIDTTWSALGSSIWHLASHPADRDRLRAEPALISTAIEEFLRAYSPVMMARVVNEDTELNGCAMKAGEAVLLCFPAANRDPTVFAEADRVLIDRQENRHVAFGLGIHRCIGSNLARLEMTVAVQEWLRRIPAFGLDPVRPVEWSAGPVRGPRRMPLLIGAAVADRHLSRAVSPHGR